jgi:hypothetical protein
MGTSGWACLVGAGGARLGALPHAALACGRGWAEAAAGGSSARGCVSKGTQMRARRQKRKPIDSHGRSGRLRARAPSFSRSLPPASPSSSSSSSLSLASECAGGNASTPVPGTCSRASRSTSTDELSGAALSRSSGRWLSTTSSRVPLCSSRPGGGRAGGEGGRGVSGRERGAAAATEPHEKKASFARACAAACSSARRARRAGALRAHRTGAACSRCRRS